jgi:hypothetical protein
MSRDLEKARERKKRYLARKHEERFGRNAGDQRGRHSNHRRAASHPRWNDTRIESSTGYVKIRVGIDHPLADPNGYAYEHLVVWVAAGRAAPPPGFVLHHRNEVKDDNRLDNLEVKSRADHNAEHLTDRSRDALGRLVDGKMHRKFPT